MKLQFFRMAYKPLADLAPAHVPTLPTLLKLGQRSHKSSQKSQAPAHGNSARAAPPVLRTARLLPAPRNLARTARVADPLSSAPTKHRTQSRRGVTSAYFSVPVTEPSTP